MRRRVWLASLLFVTILIGSCGTPPPPGGSSDPNDVPMIIDPDTTVVGEEDGSDTFTVDGDTVIFSEPADAADIEVGDILVSAEGTGLLRKATAIREVNGTVEVDTESAALIDAVESGAVETTLSLGQSPDGASLGVQSGELRPQAFEPITFDFAQVLYDGTVEDPDLGSANLLLEISQGALSFTPDIDLDVVIRNREIDTFSVITSGELKLDVELHLNASGALDVSDSVLVTPAGKDHLYQHTFTQWIGWVPVVEVVTLDVELGYLAQADAELDVTSSAGATAILSLGALYQSGDWTPVSSNGFETRFEAPATTAYIQGFGYVYAKPILSIDLYGVAGPELAIEGGPRLDIDSQEDPWWTLKALLGSTAQFNLGVLDYELSSPEFILFEREWLLAASDGSTPVDPVQVAIHPTSVMLEPSAAQEFTVTVQNATDTSVTWDATCGTIDGAGITVTYTAPSSEGSCSVTVTSVEDTSAQASAAVTVAEPNADPVINSFTVTPSNVTVGDTVTFSWSVSDPDGDPVACSLDVDGDGTGDYTISDCLATTTQNHAYVTSGSFAPTLSAADGGGADVQASTSVQISRSDVSFTKIVGGADHSVGIDANGLAWAWGGDYDGQLGNDENYEDQSIPVPVAMPSGVSFVAIDGSWHTLALDESGNAWAWGWDRDGQLGDGGSNTDMATPVEVVMPDGVGFTSIATGGGFSVALDFTGAAWAWGEDFNGQLGDGGSNTDQSIPVQVAMPVGVTFTDVDAGAFHSLALGSTGTAWAWGYDYEGQLGDGGTNTDRSIPVQVAMPVGVTFTDVDAGAFHSLALDSTGTAWAWGRDTDGQLGDGGTNTHRSVPVPVEMPVDVRFVAIAAGTSHSLALDSTGTAWAWGYAGNGQLGTGDTGDQQVVPVQVSMPDAVALFEISAGSWHSLAIDDSGGAWSWGFDRVGQLGDGGTNSNQSEPVQVVMP